MKGLPIRKLVIGISVFTLSLVIGTTGYILIENYRWENAFYMAVITLGTVGFTEVEELSIPGRMFTSFYIIFNLAAYAYIIAVFGQYFFEGEIGNIFKKLNTEKKIKRMNRHVIICGYGRNGSKAAEELLKNNLSVVVVEQDTSLLKSQQENNNLVFIEGNATQDEILMAAGIDKARAIITTLPDDAENVFITLTAREMNKEIQIISRASSTQSEKKLKRAGANDVVMPEFIGGFHMASLITQPDIIPFANLIDTYLSEELRIEEVTSEELAEQYRNQTLAAFDFRSYPGIIVLGYKRVNGDFIFKPGEDIKMQGKEALILLGTNKDMDAFRKAYMIQT